MKKRYVISIVVEEVEGDEVSMDFVSSRQWEGGHFDVTHLNEAERIMAILSAVKVAGA